MKKYYWMAVKTAGQHGWDEEKQYPIYGTWVDVVKTAKAQGARTRLSNTAGYDNQGYYFQPEKLENGAGHFVG